MIFLFYYMIYLFWCNFEATLKKIKPQPQCGKWWLRLHLADHIFDVENKSQLAQLIDLKLIWPLQKFT